MKLKTENQRIQVGWREWVSLPELGIGAIKAKVDTGAYTSAIHAEEITVYRTKQGIRKLRFTTIPLQKKKSRPEKTKVCHAIPIDRRFVTSSNGAREKRWVIRTLLKLGNKSWPIELTLSKREPMKFRMLLGRRALSGRCLVDTQHSYLQGKGPKKKVKKKVKSKDL